MAIELMPTSRAEEIAQNVDLLSRIARGSQVLDRGLGISMDAVDRASTRGQALFSAALIDALPEQEPRIEVTGVGFQVSEVAGGEFKPEISYRIVEG